MPQQVPGKRSSAPQGNYRNLNDFGTPDFALIPLAR
jgi:hypothetical protein